MSVFVNFPVFGIDGPRNEFQAGAELKANGMSQAAIDNLSKMHNEFPIEFKRLSGDEEAIEKYIEDFRNRVFAMVDAMSPEDKTIYKAYLKKYKLDE